MAQLGVHSDLNADLLCSSKRLYDMATITQEQLTSILFIPVQSEYVQEFFEAARLSEQTIRDFQNAVRMTIFEDRGCNYRAARCIHKLSKNKTQFRKKDYFKRWNIKCKKETFGISDIRYVPDTLEGHLTILRAFPKANSASPNIHEVEYSAGLTVQDIIQECAGKFRFQTNSCLLSIGTQVLNNKLQTLGEIGILSGSVLLCDGCDISHPTLI